MLIQAFIDGDDGGSSSRDKGCEDKSIGHCLGVRRRETVQQNGLKRHGSFKSSGDNDIIFERESKEWTRREGESPGDVLLWNARDNAGLDSQLEDEETTWEVFSNAEEKARATNERARQAEATAGVAAAQDWPAVQALMLVIEQPLAPFHPHPYYSRNISFYSGNPTHFRASVRNSLETIILLHTASSHALAYPCATEAPGLIRHHAWLSVHQTLKGWDP